VQVSDSVANVATFKLFLDKIRKLLTYHTLLPYNNGLSLLALALMQKFCPQS